jgi:hypothetical protein
MKIVIEDAVECYPKLMTNRYGLIILFTSKRVGTIVAIYSKNNEHSIGEFSENWNHRMFFHYTGKIILENS